ncbi:MAG: hypothetical protein KGJ90_06815 [Patescibacteria group bacterium]|nr:hypothetical protein [Patescibacteria group bacterium]
MTDKPNYKAGGIVTVRLDDLNADVVYKHGHLNGLKILSYTPPPENVGEVDLKNKMMESLSDYARGTRWLHVKSGREYTITGSCRLESTGCAAYLYMDDSGVTWARDKDEFLDGRFQQIKAVAGHHPNKQLPESVGDDEYCVKREGICGCSKDECRRHPENVGYLPVLASDYEQTIQRLEAEKAVAVEIMEEIDSQLGDLPPWSIRLKQTLAKLKGQTT